ncbi:SDR family NAD(P)-dependent oxidoreductase [Saccharothrix sp. HUAS TT1]|uniref:SDR family NAD(P)-dependent oxidoreductase n=1 Tax=unclassified Saccharothrix TaxID=2593673 RepID=UPI00345C1E8F
MSPVVLVTGGGGGIGSAVVDALSRAGATAVVASRSTASPGIALDVTREGEWTRAVDEVLERHGRLDGLVNAAGDLGGTEQGLLTARPEQWTSIMDTHVVGTWLGCREVVGRGFDHPVSIVNLASTAGQLATPGMVAYGAAKAAVLHLTKSVALHCARSGVPVRCNAVAPALVDAGLRDEVLATLPLPPDEAMAAYRARVPLGRLVDAAEVAEAVVFLLLRAGGSLTGEVITLSGGLGLA